MLRHQRHATITLYTLSLILLVAAVGYSSNAVSASYSVVLESMANQGNKWRAKPAADFSGKTLFVTTVTVNGKVWERLNLGVFDNRNAADTAAKKVKKLYPGAWINTLTAAELNQIKNNVKLPDNTRKAAPPPKPVISVRPKPRPVASASNQTKLTDTQLDEIMTRAKKEFKNERYSQSIRLFDALVSAGESKYSREALEYLGLARYRNNQKAHAQKIYEQYIALYPDDESTERVKQRLSGIITETSAPRKSINMEAERKTSESVVYGSVSQIYRNDNITLQDGTDNVLSQLMTFLDFTAIQKYKSFEQKFQLTVDDRIDLNDSVDLRDFRFIEFYYDIAANSTGTSVRLGRQTSRIGGLLNRFDGATVGYQLTPDMRINVLGGYPVEITNQSSINSHKQFYGVTFETGTFLRNWDMNIFHFRQTNDGIDDMISIGTEVQYRDDKLSAYGLFDYDTLFNVVNIAMVNINLILNKEQTVYLNSFMRKAPILSVDNALIGRPELTIEELQQTFNIEQIHQMALDRTANSQTITVGGSQVITETLQANLDITLSEIDDTVTSFDVEGIKGTGTDYYVNTQLVANNLFLNRDTHIFGIRYLSTDPADTISLIFNARYPVTREWRINPRIQLDLRTFQDGSDQTKTSYIVKTDYRYARNVRFDFELGYQSATGTSDISTLTNDNLYFTAAYRFDF